MLVGLYVRVSTSKQFEKGYSIEEQTERLTKYCEAMNWDVYKVYTDGGFSGANIDRPALQTLVKDVKSHKIQKVVVYKLDRLSRSQKDTLYLIEEVFLNNDVDFVSMSENFDTATPFGKAMIGILSVFAQLEREQIRERLMMGKEARAKEGKFHGSALVPIGYEYVDGQLISNDFEKMQIQKIFDMYESGIMPNKITQRLNDSGYNHKYGKWIHETVRRVLDNKTYIGYLPYNGEWYKGEHEAFISEEQFERVQRIKKQRYDSHKKINARAGKASSYLGGLMFCAHCGAKYYKATIHSQGKYRYVYYRCESMQRKTAKEKSAIGCNNKTYRMQDLDQLIIDEIKKLDFETIKQAPTPDNSKVIDKEVKDIEAKIDKLMELYASDDIPKNVLQDKIKALSEQKDKLMNELNNEPIEPLQDLLNTNIEIADILDNGDIDEVRAIITALIDKIEIDNEDVAIHWNFV